MKLISFFLTLLSVSLLFAQEETYSIEYENHKIGVFNPEKDIYHNLLIPKQEHITGYFREEMARGILQKVKNKEIKIYDERKRELSIDSVINQIIVFEQQHFNHTLKKEEVLDFIIPFVSAYDFEEAVRYDYRNLSIEKTVLSYCPYLVRYKGFEEDNHDTVQMPLFRIFFSKNDVVKDKKDVKTETLPLLEIPDTVRSLLTLKYPVKMPFTFSVFEQVKNKKKDVLHSDGSPFKTMQEIDDLFVLVNTVFVYDEDTGKETSTTVYSDILPEDIEALRIGETWTFNPNTLEIIKKVEYFLPLMPSSYDAFRTLDLRILNSVKR
ncbi:MAG: hypothetical protein IJ748_06235 [Bacteroidales bacterium]|nr:hypothetical protein [Bacteroidales bacterium]